MSDSSKDKESTSNNRVPKQESIQSKTGNEDLNAQSQEFCFTGYFTRGVKRHLETAISKGAMYSPVTSSNSVTTAITSSLYSSSTTTQTSTSPPAQLLSASLNSTMTTSTPDTSKAINCSRIARSQSMIAHILTGEDKNLGANVMMDTACGDILSEEDAPFVEPQTAQDAECSDVEIFLDDSLRCSSLIGKFGNAASEWELDTHESDCARKEIIASPEQSLALPIDNNMSSMKTWDKCTTCLIVQNEAKGVELRQEIIQALQISDIKVITIQEATDLCSIESFTMIWVHVSLPVEEEILDLVTSLRYSIKENKSACLIAVTDRWSDVDLLRHGFDEVYVEPIPKDIIYQKHQKFKFEALPDLPSADNLIVIRERTSTPESTVSLESVKTTEYSQSSTCDSVSSGLDITDINITDLRSTFSASVCNKSPFFSEVIEKEDGKSPTVDPHSPPSWCRVEHATKEKQRSQLRKLPAHTEKERRERIKDSCDQLRVLLPYVKGRKTDMASILEMTVDYLKIVNAALPQDFQSHVIDIMSNGSSVLEERLGDMERISMASTKICKRKTLDRDKSPVGQTKNPTKKNSMQTNFGSSKDQTLANKIVTRSHSHAEVSIGTFDKVSGSSQTDALINCTSNTNNTNAINGLGICKRECPSLTKSGSTKAKRPHMAIVSTLGDIHSPSVVYLPTGSVASINDTKKENILGEVTNQDHHFTGSQFPHYYTEGDSSASHMFSSSNVANDMFPYQNHTQMNTPVARSTSDLNTYGGMYFDGTFYHYYPPIQDSSNGNYFIPGGSSDYVNPNAVLPMTGYTSRASAFSNSCKFERTSTDLERFVINEQNPDMFNNNISGLKPSSA